MTVQDKQSEKGFYDRLFSTRQRFDQFQNTIYDRMSAAARSSTAGTSALDLGCGSGTQALSLVRHGFVVTAVDLSTEATKLTRRAAHEHGAPVTVINADAEHLPLPDQSFDACICSLLLHHFPDLGPLADELRRLVRPGGVVVTLDANAHNPFVWLFFNAIHRVRPLRGLTPNQRALWRGEIRAVFGERGFGDFAFESFSTDLRKDWLGGSLGARLNYYSRRAVLRASEAMLPQICHGNALMAVFRRLPDAGMRQVAA